MSTIPEQIESIQEEIRKTPYHKGTEHHIGRLRARLSQLKDKQLEGQSTSKGGSSGASPAGRQGYAVKKQGDATIVLVGPPSAGKSTLLNKLTNAHSKVAPYEFTTVTVIPGMMHYKDARIQILDVPGLITGAGLGKGRGREVLSVVRGSNLVVLLTDTNRSRLIDKIKKELESTGIRINKLPPQVNINKKLKGGIELRSNIMQEFNYKTVKEIVNQYRLTNAEITIKEKITLEQLIDCFSPNRVYIPAISVINKSDLKDTKGKADLIISAKSGTNLDKLRDLIWDKLSLIRVYLIKPGEQPHNNTPLVVKSGVSLQQVADKLGTEFSEEVKGAKIWGPGAKHPAQQVSLETQAQEGMQVRFIK